MTHWEYRWFSTVAGMRGIRDPSPNTALQQAVEVANELGVQGWEMVNFTTTARYESEQRAAPNWIVVCFMKRPITS